MSKNKYTTKYLIQELQYFAEYLGRTPTIKDIRQDELMPSDKPYKDRFGSWNNAIKIAGIMPNISRKTKEQYNKELPKDIIVLEEYKGTHIKVLHQHICGYKWKVRPHDILTGHSCPRCAGNIRTHKDYVKLLDELTCSIKVIQGTYINKRTKLLHKHSCGYIWEATPETILKNKSCPNCSISGFKLNEPAITYLIHFYALDIYKVGITNRTIKQRFRQEPQPYEIIFYREFEKGQEAKNLETEWLNNLKPLLYNTGELKSGNTETFIECL